MKDVGPIKKPAPTSSKAETVSSPTLKTPQAKTISTEKENKVENKVKITQLFDFAGEKVE